MRSPPNKTWPRRSPPNKTWPRRSSRNKTWPRRSPPNKTWPRRSPEDKLVRSPSNEVARSVRGYDSHVLYNVNLIALPIDRRPWLAIWVCYAAYWPWKDHAVRWEIGRYVYFEILVSEIENFKTIFGWNYFCWVYTANLNSTERHRVTRKGICKTILGNSEASVPWSRFIIFQFESIFSQVIYWLSNLNNFK